MIGFKTLVAWGIGIIIGYYLVPALYWVLIAVMAVYIIYKLYRIADRKMNPGKRIKHSMLKNYMVNKYGKDEGVRIYRDTVSELNKKGYK